VRTLAALALVAVAGWLVWGAATAAADGRTSTAVLLSCCSLVMWLTSIGVYRGTATADEPPDDAPHDPTTDRPDDPPRRNP
jgi:hypothetical protein